MDRQFSFHPFRSVCAIGLLSISSLVLMHPGALRRVEPSSAQSHSATAAVAAPQVSLAEFTSQKANRVSTQLPGISVTPKTDRNLRISLSRNGGPTAMYPCRSQLENKIGARVLHRSAGH